MKQALWKPMIYGGIRPIKAIVMSKKNLRGKKASQHISLFPFFGIITWWVQNMCPQTNSLILGLTQSETPPFSAPAATFLQFTFLLILAGEQTCHQCRPRENFVKKLHLSTIRLFNHCHQRVLRGRGRNWASVEIGVDIISLFISGQNGNSLISEEGLSATKTSTIGRYVFHPWILFIILIVTQKKKFQVYLI